MNLEIQKALADDQDSKRCLFEQALHELRGRQGRPELREKRLAIDNILRNLRDAGWIACKKGDSVSEVYESRNQILALYPDEGEIRRDEKDKILTLLEKEYPPITTWPCWHALKELKGG